MVVQQTDSVPSDETAKRISSDTELRDSVALFLQLLKPSLNLICNALAAKLNAIVSEAARVALRYKNVKIGESLSNAGGQEFEVVWLTPETGPCQPNDRLLDSERGESRLMKIDLPVN